MSGFPESTNVEPGTGVFRSEEMQLIQLIIQTEAARSTVQQLGERSIIQFRDMNPEVNAFQRTYVQNIRRCEEMERRIRFLATQLTRLGIEPRPVEDEFTIRSHSVSLAEIDELDAILVDHEAKVRQLNQNEETIRRNQRELIELATVLHHTSDVLESTSGGIGASPHEHLSINGGRDAGATSGSYQPLSSTAEDPYHDLEHGAGAHAGSSAGGADAVTIDFVCGIIPRSKVSIFERVLFRALRGNVHTRIADDDSHLETEELQEDNAGSLTGAEGDDASNASPADALKSVFVVFSHGLHAQEKIIKIAESFEARLYNCPRSRSEREQLLQQIEARRSDMGKVLTQTTAHNRRSFLSIAESISLWAEHVRKEKATYHLMNMFSHDMSSRCLVAEGWMPKTAMGALQVALDRGTAAAGTNIPSVVNILTTREKPPTHFNTNRFTEGFQAIVDAYGISTYREINPAPFSIITFPFMFAVMFGDLGHAVMMTLGALLVCINEKKLVSWKQNELLSNVYFGRYIILLMGLFSIFTGLIYNDIFSKGMPLFKSGWAFPPSDPNGSVVGTFTGHIYAIGLDIGWFGSDNFLIFSNSYKMKMSIVLGIVHMSAGLLLSLFNHLHFKRRLHVINEFIPRVIFLFSIFGYLLVCIILKWATDWTNAEPPSLLDLLIFMFLSPGRVDAPLYSGQSTVQVILLIMALLAVPWMLIVKPMILKRRYAPKPGSQSDYSYLPKSTDHSLEGEEDDHHVEDSLLARMQADPDLHLDGDEFNFGEVMIHSSIHTIDFVLGCISNTASYLRLWALSLAHAQLSEVLWTMTLGNGLNGTADSTFMYGAMLVVCFAAWLCLTIAVLICMEGLSAFLHALRLHWVEFNNKFFEGAGHKFLPFTYDPEEVE